MDLLDTVPMQLSTFMPPPNAAPHPHPHPRTGAKYRAYTEEDMARAEEAITEQGMSLRQASVRFRVPKTTLAERLGDRRPKPAPRKKKSDDEENNNNNDNNDSNNSNGRRTTRYHWTEADMASAVEAVRSSSSSSGGGATTVAEAARRFGVPPSQLNARTRGRATKDLRSEMSRLSLRQEGLLADWAAAQGALGCPPTKDEVFGLAERVLRKQQQQQQQQKVGPERRLGKQWIVHWMRRYPDIEILEWEPKEPKGAKEVKAKTRSGGSQKAEQTFRFEVGTFEPVVDLGGMGMGMGMGMGYGAPGTT